ncbi:MAG TPA: hypothetical protein VMP03_16780 [Methylomirabilota bacterium]|nr:hypothetical protein [Methylomirabilota bacterium]
MATLYSFRTKAPLTAYERLQTWRAKQHAFNQDRISKANRAVNGIFSAKMNMIQQIGDLTVTQAVTRVRAAGVNKLV